MLAIWFFFQLRYVDHFCMKSFSFFSTEGLRGRGQLHIQEWHCPVLGKCVFDASPSPSPAVSSPSPSPLDQKILSPRIKKNSNPCRVRVRQLFLILW